jgi:hypothetical protein
MSKFIYCSNCGFKIQVFRKAIPSSGIIIDMIEPHECYPEPIELDLKPVQIPQFEQKAPKGKLVTKLEDLSQSKHFPRPSELEDRELKDRRFDRRPASETSSAPISLLEQIKSEKGID